MPEIYVLAPTLKSVELQLDLADTADTVAHRSAIEAALTSLIQSEQDNQAELLEAELDAAISTVTTQFTRLSPTATLTCAPGEIFALPTISWT